MRVKDKTHKMIIGLKYVTDVTDVTQCSTYFPIRKTNKTFGNIRNLGNNSEEIEIIEENI